MNTKNFLIGGIVGGLIFFLLGYLFYGVIFNQYFLDHPGTATNVARAMDQMQWWALILGNILEGFVLSYIFVKAGVATLSSGLTTGGIVGLLIGASIGLIMYGTTNMYSKHSMVADIGITTVRFAIAGAVIAVVLGMINKRTTVNTTTV